MNAFKIIVNSAVLCTISNAFVVNDVSTLHKPSFLSTTNNEAVARRLSSPRTISSLLAAHELLPEPEGGEEVNAVNVMPGSRIKNLGEDDDERKSKEGGTVYKFWLSATADGSMIKKMRTQVMKDASKNANFPGFRKGQVPPYAQPQMTMFAVQEGIVKTCEAALEAYGLEALKGSDGSVEVNEEVKDMCKGYKVGDDVEFTGNFSATIKETAAPTPTSTTSEDEDVSEEENETSTAAAVE